VRFSAVRLNLCTGSCYNNYGQENKLMNIDKTFQSAIEEYNKGDLKQAETLSKKILIKKPKHADTLNLLGMIAADCKERGELRKALYYFQKVLQLSTAFVEAYNNIGSILNEQGKIAVSP
jgi:Tfp pilus assembly protein PilF